MPIDCHSCEACACESLSKRATAGDDSDDTDVFFIALPDYVQHFRCSTINYVSSARVSKNVVTHEYDFTQDDDSNKPYQIATFNIALQKQIDLGAETFAISINQQGDRLQTYRSLGPDRYEPARFNIILLHHPSGNGPPTIMQVEQANWFQTSLVVRKSDAMQTMPRGNYSVVMIAFWNQVAYENPDYQRIRINVHSPCMVNLTS